MKYSLSKFFFLDLNKPSNMASPIQLFVGDHWLVIHGTSFDTEFHRHHAAQWAFLADGNVSARTVTGYAVSGRGLFVPPNVDHAFQSTAAVVMVFWEPEHDLVRGYMNQISCSDVMPCDIPDELPASWTEQAASKIANACVRHELKNHVVNKELDARVCLAQQLIHQQLDQPLHLEDIAQKVHVSGAHLARLFRLQMRATFRAYVRWCRLRRAIEIALDGHPLTTAAHQSGFSDSAHLSRTFKEMFGVSPQFLFGRRDLLDVQILV